MAYQFTNNASTTLASSLTATATSLTVVSGGGSLFPVPTATDFFHATLADATGNLEIVRVTTRSTDTFTILRAQEGTTARVFAAGDRIELRITAAAAKSLASLSGAAFTGPVSGTTASFSGAVSGGSVAATGAVSGATATLTGAVSAASASITNGVSAGSVTATGAVSGATATFTGAASAASVTVAADATLANQVTRLSQVQTAIASAFAAVPGKNRIINGTFAVNQRNFAGGALAAGSYGHDRWKASAGGATYTVSGGSANITAGAITQVIEGANVPEGGTFTLSWEGTAQGKVNGGATLPSPITVTGLTANANVTIQFFTGTVTKVQFEAGSVRTAYERVLAPVELSNAQRYYWRLQHSVRFGGTMQQNIGAQNYMNVPFPVQMRVTPTVENLSFSNGIGNANQSILSVGPTGAIAQVTATGANNGQVAVTLDAGTSFNAEI